MALYINGNKTGGGGGNADIVHLTQAEYDALPDSKLTDDKVYMLEDVNGDGSQFQPVIYSENEREIGVWTDGKPLYQKTFIFIPTDNNFYIDVASLNIDKVVENRGSIYQEGGNIVPIPYYTANSDFAIAYYNNTNSSTNRLGIVQNSNGYNLNVTWVVTWKYTKTTDTAGSGTWTPQGVPAVHYSTEEQVVGTWVDGSTLYEKTVIVSNMMIGYDGTIHTSIPHNISNFGYATSLNILCPKLGISSNNILIDGRVIAEFRVDDTNIYAHSGNDHYGESEDRIWYFTIQYTKTTT